LRNPPHGHVLTPGRYVGAEAAEEDDEHPVERFAAQDKLEEQFAEAGPGHDPARLAGWEGWRQINWLTASRTLRKEWR
jgi:hypothetical protein